MIIEKVMNNNVVFALDNQRKEVVLVGKGIGFKQKKGFPVDESKIEKKFVLETDIERHRLADLLSRISERDFDIADNIIRYAEKTLGKRLNENIYITLTDHVVFAMQRVKQGITFTNQLLWEIKSFYPDEFAIGMYGIDHIKEKTGIQMPEDEAGYIAYHIADAHADDNLPMVETTAKIINNALRIVEMTYNLQLDEASLDYGRFVIHLKFCIERVFSGKMLDHKDSAFVELIRNQYAKAYDCALRISRYIGNSYGHYLTDDELVYLTVHIKRVTDSAAEKAEEESVGASH